MSNKDEDRQQTTNKTQDNTNKNSSTNFNKEREYLPKEIKYSPLMNYMLDNKYSRISNTTKIIKNNSTINKTEKNINDNTKLIKTEDEKKEITQDKKQQNSSSNKDSIKEIKKINEIKLKDNAELTNSSNNNKENVYTMNNHDIDFSALKIRVNQLNKQKENLEKEIIVLRRKLKEVKSIDYSKKLNNLEKIKSQAKSEAYVYLNVCSQLAEELIHLRSKLDKYQYDKGSVYASHSN